MVFSNLGSHEKDAFFSLLDEYFASRPDVFGNITGSSDGAGLGIGGAGAGGAAASAVHRALANNPEATSRLVSAGLKHGVPKSSPYSAAASNPDIANAAGRVAAAGLSFSARNHGGGNDSTSPPQRSAPPVAEKPSGVAGLVSSRRFGDVDTTSKGNFLGSLYTPGKNKSPPPAAEPVAPAPSGGWKNKFGPPPPRTSVAAEPAPKAPSPPPPEPEPQEEEAAHGEWADVLYDYNSGEATDLVITAGERVLVTERTSDDWWTGKFNGKSGLFPATYVQLL